MLLHDTCDQADYQALLDGYEDDCRAVSEGQNLKSEPEKGDVRGPMTSSDFMGGLSCCTARVLERSFKWV